MPLLFRASVTFVLLSCLCVFAETDDSGHSGDRPAENTAAPETLRPLGLGEAEIESINLEEYLLGANNYNFADDHCYTRAHRVIEQAIQRAERRGIDPRGPDGKWETDDDMVKKVFALYPSGGKWWFHVAACVRDDKGNMTACDAIGGHLKPYASPEEWGKAWAHDDRHAPLEVVDVGLTTPPAGKCSISVQSFNQISPNNKISVDEALNFKSGYLADKKNSLKSHVNTLSGDGKKPTLTLHGAALKAHEGPVTIKLTSDKTFTVTHVLGTLQGEGAWEIRNRKLVLKGSYEYYLPDSDFPENTEPIYSVPVPFEYELEISATRDKFQISNESENPLGFYEALPHHP